MSNDLRMHFLKIVILPALALLFGYHSPKKEDLKSHTVDLKLNNKQRNHSVEISTYFAPNPCCETEHSRVVTITYALKNIDKDLERIRKKIESIQKRLAVLVALRDNAQIQAHNACKDGNEDTHVCQFAKDMVSGYNVTLGLLSFDSIGVAAEKKALLELRPKTEALLKLAIEKLDQCEKENPLVRYYFDEDGDGHGETVVTKLLCKPEPKWVIQKGDCNPNDKKVWRRELFFPDDDEDGYGDKFAEGELKCWSEPEPKWSRNRLDCDDSDERIPDLDVPNADEPCEEDLNCDGITMRCPPSELRITSRCVNDVLQVDYQIINSKMIARIEIQTSWDASNWKVIKQLSTLNQGSTPGQIIVANRDKQAKAPFVRLVGYTSRGRPTYSTFLVSECSDARPLNIAPNPSSGRIRVFLPADKTESIELSVADSKGVILELKKVHLKLGLNVIEFDLVKRSSGLYAVIVKRQGGVQVGKIIKQ